VQATTTALIEILDDRRRHVTVPDLALCFGYVDPNRGAQTVVLTFLIVPT
jgi:hypothetical protein